MMMKIYKTGQAAKYLAVTPITIQAWDRNGTLKAHRTKTGRRYYTQEELDNFLNRDTDQQNKDGLVVAYARVSTQKQKSNLKHQLAFIRDYVNAKGIILDKEVKDIASGLNYKRPGWNKLLRDVDQDKVKTIYITYKDRFVRFGFDWFEQFCKQHGTTIVVLNNPDTSPEKEVMQDLISIVHVFSCRVYGLRSYRKNIEELANKQSGDN